MARVDGNDWLNAIERFRTRRTGAIAAGPGLVRFAISSYAAQELGPAARAFPPSTEIIGSPPSTRSG